MLGFWLRLKNDERGQGMVFAVFTLFLLVCVVALVVNVWEAVHFKVLLQNAADAAAWSGAAIQANFLMILSGFNEAMVWLYRAILLIIFAVVTLGVLAALSVVTLGATSWAVPLFVKAVGVASKWIPRLISWARQIAKIERGLVRASPVLVEAEVFRIARANGADGAIAFPFPRLKVKEERNYARFLDKLAFGHAGWALKYIFPENASSSGEYSDSAEFDDKNKHGKFRNRKTRTERDVGGGLDKEPGARGHLDSYRKTLDDLRRNPLPMPMVMTRDFFDHGVNVVCWSRLKGPKERTWMDEELYKWPDLLSWGAVTTAAARPKHERVKKENVDSTNDNLYLLKGWDVEWIPFEYRLYRRWKKSTPEDPPWGAGEGPKIEESGAWIHH